MLEKMMQTLIPLLIAKIKDVSPVDKLEFAYVLNDLCERFISDDKDSFAYLLSKTSLPDTWQQSLVKALWSNEN